MELFTLGAGPGRVHRGRRAPAGPGAHRLALRLELAARRAQLPLRRRSATTGREDDLRPDRRLRLGRTRVAVRLEHPSTRPSSSRSCGATSSPTRRRPPTRTRWSSTYATSGYQVRPRARGDPPPPAAPHGPADGQAARGVRRRDAARAAPCVDPRPGGGSAEAAGQRLFLPPDVAGWDDERWLDTGTVRGRWMIVELRLSSRYIQGPPTTNYDATETPSRPWPRRSPSGATPT